MSIIRLKIDKAGQAELYKNRAEDGRNNICGKNVKRLRQGMAKKTSQRMLAYLLQMKGLDVDKNAIQRIESGERFVTDIELKMMASVLDVSVDALLSDPND